MIGVEHLTRDYGPRRAVDDLSFHVDSGEVVGFLGPNGAGKTTTMRMITGYLVPTSGTVTVAGVDALDNSLEARRQVGYLPESVPLYRDMTTRSYLQFMARLHGLDKSRARARVSDVVETCGLEDYVDVLIAKLSKGYRQRVGLSQAIIHDPPVLVLDEPTIGIDPIQAAETKRLIKDLGHDRTILISSHVLSEVSQLCRRVIIIDQGKLVAEDSIDSLSTRLAGGRRLRVMTAGGPPTEVTARLEAIESVRSVTYDGSGHLVDYAQGEEPQAEIARAIVESGWSLLATEKMDMNLEDIFLQVTGTAGAAEDKGAPSGGDRAARVADGDPR